MTSGRNRHGQPNGRNQPKASLNERITTPEERYCEEGCGRELYPHEMNYCGICSGVDDETTRGPIGAFVLPVAERAGVR